jgi:phosphatidylserine decarboxylase
VKFAKDGYDVIAWAVGISLVLTAFGLWIGSWPQWILIGMAVFSTAFTLYFFRDPDRVTPADPNLIISPADGKVILIQRVFEPQYLKEEVTQVSIFLSPMNVHVNRIPVSGVVEFKKYVPGQYLVAWHEKASDLNERSEFGVRHASGKKMFFKQITGYIARRITFHLNEGDQVVAGERFGMMKFGSRMDLLFPDSFTLDVKIGDVTVAGETILGRVE